MVDLVSRAGQGRDSEPRYDLGFEVAYPDFYRQAFIVAFRLLGSEADAVDTAQEACARALVRWNRVSRHPNPMAWVARVSANLAMDVHRRRATARRKMTLEVESHDTGNGGFGDGERVDLRRALDTLPRRQRQVVLLRYVADLSDEAVAAELGCSARNVRSLAARGLAALRTHLGVEE
jgi:RNA polymerase sigma factor (sigma-70 family)